MDEETERRAIHAEFQIGALQGHRIAVDTVLRTIITDLYANIEDGAARLESVFEAEVTAMHGISPEPIGQADAEFIKQQALHSLEGLLQGLPNAVRQQRGEPQKRPD